jgi:cell filamentation protein
VSDPYVDPTFGVLVNKLGITDEQTLLAAEAEITTLRDSALADVDVQGLYDLDHLCAFHARLFSDVYPWAGQIRTVDISKEYTRFCPASQIRAWAASDVFPLISRREIWHRAWSHEEMTEHLTVILAEINALHPFREGNGRTQRAFLRQLAATAGWIVHWESLDPDENIAASRAAMVDDLGPLKAIIGARLSRFTPRPTALE